MQPEDQSKLNRLKDALYSRTKYIPDDPIRPLSKKEQPAPITWETIPELPVRPGVPFVKIVIWFSVVFFLGAASFAGYLFYTGYNTISASNVTLLASGPTQLNGGEPLSLAVVIENRNTTNMQDITLSVEYPEGTLKSIDSARALIRERIDIDPLASGAKTSKLIQAVFFGEEGQTKEVQFKLQYSVPDSTGLFEKTTSYRLTLGPAPIIVTETSTPDISSGQEITLDFTLDSNTTLALPNLAFELTYPQGFTFISASPMPSYNTNVWDLGTVTPGTHQKIQVKGRLEGPESETRAFRYQVGAVEPNAQLAVVIPYVSASKIVTLQRPFIGFTVGLNGNTSDTVFIKNGETISANLGITNNLSEALSNVRIEVNLAGAYLDRNKISAGQGFYQTATDLLTWDQRQIRSLSSLASNGQTNVQFNFGTIPISQSRTAQVNQPITVTITARGTRASAVDATQQVYATTVRTVKFLSDVDLNGSIFYNSGPFANRGPLPPKAEQETTYTVVWTLYNTYNQLTDGEVRAVLPSYITFLNNVSPATEGVTYNPTTGEVVWRPGSIPANTGYGTAPRQVAFQISLTPSRTQIGSAPQLIGQATFTATDSVTKNAVEAVEIPLTTQITTDQGYRSTMGVISQ